MNKRNIITMALACGVLSLAVVGNGCKKEEPKVEQAAPAPVVQKTSGDLFQAQISTASVPETVKKGSTFELKVTVKNTSSATWLAKGADSTRLSYHWRDAKTNKSVVWDGKRTFLPKDLAPGEEVTLTAKIDAPADAGKYTFQLDMVQEKVGWFRKLSSHKIDVN